MLKKVYLSSCVFFSYSVLSLFASGTMQIKCLILIELLLVSLWFIFVFLMIAAAVYGLGDQWSNTPSNWNSGDPCDDNWVGIHCDNNSHVTSMWALESFHFVDLMYLYDMHNHKLISSVIFQNIIELGTRRNTYRRYSIFDWVRNLVSSFFWLVLFWAYFCLISISWFSYFLSLVDWCRDLSYNKGLTGQIPAFIGSLSKLENLYVI